MLGRDPDDTTEYPETAAARTWPAVEPAERTAAKPIAVTGAAPDPGADGPPKVVDDARLLLRSMQELLAEFDALDLSELTPTELLAALRDLDVIGRTQAAVMDRVVDRCDRSAAHCADGYRSTKPCIQRLGRLSGAEAHRRVATARALRLLPVVAEAYAAARIPIDSVRVIARVAANPRVQDALPVADPDIAEKASTMGHREFVAWLKQWEWLVDTDGGFREVESGHERRDGRLVRNDIDATWQLDGRHGDLQGSAMNTIFRAFIDAEFAADWDEAKARFGDEACHSRLGRTDAQRRADALYAIFLRAAAQPADARSPEPVVNIVADAETFENEVRRHCGQRVPDDPRRVDDVICHTIDGQAIHPSDAIAAALVGHIRRVLVDAESNVIDVGRKRRLFTGTSRDAAFLQRLIRDRGGTGCRWPGCHTHHRRLQVDHVLAWRKRGPTNTANSDLFCGPHNRLKESGYTPIRNAEGSLTILRPDGTPITEPA